MDKAREKGMWKRTLSLFTRFRIPYPLYVLQVIFGIISTKVALLYVPYEADIKLGNFDDPSVVWKYTGFLLLIVVVSFISAIPSFYSDSIVNRNLQNSLIRHSMRLPLGSFENGASQLVSWITQDCSYANGFITAIVGFITGIAASYMSIRSMQGIDNSMTYIAIFTALYIIFSTWIGGRLMFLRERRGRLANAELTAYLAEHLSFFTEIRQLHTEKEERRRGHIAIENFYKADVYQAFMTLINLLVSGSISNVISILVFVFGAAKVNNGTMTLADLAAFQAYILLLYQSLSSFPDLYTNFMYYNGVLYYIASLMGLREEDLGAKRSFPHPGDIAFDHVSFAYDGKAVLDDVSFRIPEGGTTLIVGPNGSGKTTIFKLIERFYLPDKGTVTIGGENAEEFTLSEWRRKFGYVLQDSQMLNGTIRDNIAYGSDHEPSGDEIAEAARLAGAAGFIEEFEDGYDHRVGENGSKISGGQRQRIAVARALMAGSPYLLLDEATSNMDIYSAREVTRSVRELMDGRTIIMISHDMDMALIADHIIVLNDGRVEAEGSHKEVLEKSMTYRMLAGASGTRRENEIIYQ